jgi:hypothetical protein
MIELARQNVVEKGLEKHLEFRVLPTEQLGTLQAGTIFGSAFSNFSGLNCVQDLAAVRQNLACRLKPGSRVLLCMLGRSGIWQKLWHLAHRDWNRVFRSAPSTTDVGGPSRSSIRRASRSLRFSHLISSFTGGEGLGSQCLQRTWTTGPFGSGSSLTVLTT